MTMQHGLLVPVGPVRAFTSCQTDGPACPEPESRRNHPAATRIGRPYGESRLERWFYPGADSQNFSSFSLDTDTLTGTFNAPVSPPDESLVHKGVGAGRPRRELRV
jgi:hypothetical protein